MRDNRNIHVAVGDAVMHLQTGIEYTVIEANDKDGTLRLELLAKFVRKDKHDRDEIMLQGWMKIPSLRVEVENEKRALEVVEKATGVRMLDRVKSAVGL